MLRDENGRFVKGHIKPLEFIAKMSLKGENHPMWGTRKEDGTYPLSRCENISVAKKMMNKKQSFETRKKIYFSRIGKTAGENHPKFKTGEWSKGYTGGFSGFIKKFIKKESDGCVLCFKGDGELHVHHVDGGKINQNVENLICLCKVCHHSIHGNNEFWEGTPYLNRKGGDG